MQFKFLYRFCANANTTNKFQVSDFVVVDCGNGQYDMGVVSKILTPEEFVLNEQLNLDRISERKIVRQAEAQERAYLPIKHSEEIKLFQFAKNLVMSRNMEFKVYGVEYQFDGNRVTVYYTAKKAEVDLSEFVQEMTRHCDVPVAVYRTPSRIRYSAKSFASRSLVTGQRYVARAGGGVQLARRGRK